MKLLAGIMVVFLLGSAVGTSFAEIHVPEKIFRDQDLTINVTNAKTDYVTAVVYDVPTGNPFVEVRKVMPNGSATFAFNTDDLVPPYRNYSYSQGDPGLRTLVYVDGLVFEFHTRIVEIYN